MTDDALTDVNEIVELASRLIERPSVTPDDAGCQAMIGRILETQGFTVMELSSGPVSNLWAVRGKGSPMIVLAGHTDVVPADRKWYRLRGL